MKTFRYRDELALHKPLAEVFDFFARAANLERLTPDWLRFEILTPGPIEMKVGALIDYRIKWRSIPMRWRTEIEIWDPPHRFVDRQLSGPYRLWRHEHLFEERGNGTEVIDQVEYAPFGGAIVNRLAVARDVRRIFNYRRQTLQQIFHRTSI